MIALRDRAASLRWLALAVPLLSPDLGRAQAQEQGPTTTTQDVRGLREQVDGLVRSQLNELWYPRSLDRERGGFHQTFARDWSALPDENRFLVYQARMTWTAAAFAEYADEHREAFLEYARHGIAYLDEVMRDHEQGGFHWLLDARGEVDPNLGTDKHVYGTAFVVYAGARAYEATRDERALQVARDAFDWLEAHAHDPEHGGYFEDLTREGTPIVAWSQDEPISKRIGRLSTYYGFKTMNAHIHLLEAVAELAKVDSRPVVKERLAELLAIVRDRIAAEPGTLNLYLTRDWQATAAHDSFGHDVETAYLLVEAAEVLGIPDDEHTWHMARRLVDHALDWGWDDRHGGFYDKGEAFNGAAFDLDKVWWTQVEGLNALLVMHRRYGDQTDRYWQAFLKQWQFINQSMIDPEHGGFYNETTREGALVGDDRKATQWKACYHTGRALMNVARLLGELDGATAEGGHDD